MLQLVVLGEDSEGSVCISEFEGFRVCCEWRPRRQVSRTLGLVVLRRLLEGGDSKGSGGVS